jgi:hypothetical protein
MRPGGDEVTVYVEDHSGGCVCEDCTDMAAHLGLDDEEADR